MTVFSRWLLFSPLLAVVSSVCAQEPGALTTSRANYQKALDRATAPIHEKYLQHLTQLQRDFTRNNDLDGALAIRQEIDALKKVMHEGGAMMTFEEEDTAASMEDELVAWLEGREFRWNGSSVDQVILYFDGNKVRAEADGRELLDRSYKVLSPNAIQFEWSNGDMNTFTVDDRKRSFIRTMARTGETHTGTIHAR